MEALLATKARCYGDLSLGKHLQHLGCRHVYKLLPGTYRQFTVGYKETAREVAVGLLVPMECCSLPPGHVLNWKPDPRQQFSKYAVAHLSRKDHGGLLPSP